MKRTYRFSLSLSAVTLLCVAAAGCMSPPIVWRHDAGERRFTATGNPLLILPLDDRRELRNEDFSLLNYVPLVPWTTETDHAFDLILEREGTKRHSTLRPFMWFNAAGDLHHAAAMQLGRGRCFGPVFQSREESGPWPGEKSREHTLKFRLNKLTLTHFHLRYGLGPLAFASFTLGAPQRRVRLDIAFGLEVRDARGKLVYEATVDSTKVFYDGWYYGLDAEQRSLNEISFVLAEALDALQENCSPGER